MTSRTQSVDEQSIAPKQTLKLPRQRKALPSLQASSGASEMADVSYPCKVESAPTQWEQLPLYAMFSLTPDGSYPKLKVTKSKYCDLRSGASDWAGSGRCYRVIL